MPWGKDEFTLTVFLMSQADGLFFGGGIDEKGITDGFFDENFKLHKTLLSEVIRSYTERDRKSIKEAIRSIIRPNLRLEDFVDLPFDVKAPTRIPKEFSAPRVARRSCGL